jgi:hypothetical protein
MENGKTHQNDTEKQDMKGPKQLKIYFPGWSVPET